MSQAPALDNLLVFTAVAETGGFTAAADRLGMTTGGVSRRIRQLEAHLGGALFVRTTRRVRLTEAGSALYDTATPALLSLRDALAQFGSTHESLSGRLRLTAPVEHAAGLLAPALARFSARHPGVAVDLRTSDSVVDLVADGLDLAIRLGHLRNSTLKAIRLGGFEQIVAASPAYLARTGTPSQPDELASMDWINFSRLQSPLTWTFTHAASGSRQTVRMRSRVTVDSTSSVRAFLESGSGVSVLDQFSLATSLKQGTLVRVLPGWTLPRGGIYAVLPPGQFVPPMVRAFIDSYRETVRVSSADEGVGLASTL